MRSKHWSRAILLTLLINDATVDKEAPSVFQQEDDEWGEGSGAELCQEETLGARVEDLRLSVLFLFPPTLEGLSLWREGEFSAACGQNTNWVWARNKKATDGFKNHYQHAASRLAFSQYIDFKLMNLPFKTQTVGVITCSSLISLSGFVIDFLLMKTNQSVVRSKFWCRCSESWRSEVTLVPDHTETHWYRQLLQKCLRNAGWMKQWVCGAKLLSDQT